MLISGSARSGAARCDLPGLSGLLSATGNGDRAAFAELYDRTCNRVYGLTLRVLRDVGFAEETTQEVYLQVWREARTFDASRGSATSWLMTLAHHRAVDRVRAEQSYTVRSLLYESRNQTGGFDQVSEDALDRIERRTVLDCLAGLSDAQRESVILAYWGGRTYREVAAVLGIPLPTVKSRVRDALICLRACLELT
jgi:RNA polymerase sigma-70 factor, ECF subfamily